MKPVKVKDLVTFKRAISNATRMARKSEKGWEREVELMEKYEKGLLSAEQERKLLNVRIQNGKNDEMKIEQMKEIEKYRCKRR